MKNDNTSKVKSLVNLLNKYRDAYYNRNESLVSDEEYDNLFDELTQLEKETGIILSNSPTITVGYEVKSELKKVKHSHLMLSLKKTKEPKDLVKFANGKECLLSLKMDGLTILLVYEDGYLVRAETRGDGEVGEDVTHNAKVFENIPLSIPIKGHYEIEGEAIITNMDFEKMNYELPDGEKKYKHPRNLASGSTRQLDSNIAKQRHLKFIAWKVPNADNMFESLLNAKQLGFTVVPFLTFSPNCKEDVENIETGFIHKLQHRAAILSYPIDGLVMTYNDMEYGRSLGNVEHHPNHSLAFKFYDEEYETKLLDVEWSMGKTDVLTPVAVFEPVIIDGSTVERASIHNLSIFNELKLCKGDNISVYKANMIIPQIKKNITASLYKQQREKNPIKWGGCIPPNKCPICGGETLIKDSGNALNLVCSNENCKGKLLGKLTHFVSKNAMNINGLSKETISKFIDLGYLNNYLDIYKLHEHYDEIMNLEGFGKRSTDKLFKAIEASKTTTLDRFVYALSIPLIGQRASRTVNKCVRGDFTSLIHRIKSAFDWTVLEDFGEAMSQSIKDYTTNNYEMIVELASNLTFEIPNDNSSSTQLENKTFVITGSLNNFANRDELKEKIESLGGKVSGSVSKKTDYLINNDIESTSGKNKKAKELNIPIINEETFLELIK